MVAVVDKNGIHLMPTTNQKARKLLKKGRAEIYSYRPEFTIRLLDREGGATQKGNNKMANLYDKLMKNSMESSLNRNGLQRAVKADSLQRPEGFILGADKKSGWALVNCAKENKNVAVLASEKEALENYVRPNVYTCIDRNKSFVVTDPKGELFRSTEKLAKEQGMEVRVLNLKDMENSDSWNPLDFGFLNAAGEKDGLIEKTADDMVMTMIRSEGEEKHESYFTDIERNLLFFLVLYVGFSDAFKGKDRTLNACYDLLEDLLGNKGESDTFDHLAEDTPEGGAWKSFSGLSENQKFSAMTSAEHCLRLLTDKCTRAEEVHSAASCFASLKNNAEDKLKVMFFADGIVDSMMKNEDAGAGESYFRDIERNLLRFLTLHVGASSHFEGKEEERTPDTCYDILCDLLKNEGKCEEYDNLPKDALEERAWKDFSDLSQNQKNAAMTSAEHCLKEFCRETKKDITGLHPENPRRKPCAYYLVCDPDDKAGGFYVSWFLSLVLSSCMNFGTYDAQDVFLFIDPAACAGIPAIDLCDALEDAKEHKLSVSLVYDSEKTLEDIYGSSAGPMLSQCAVHVTLSRENGVLITSLCGQNVTADEYDPRLHWMHRFTVGAAEEGEDELSAEERDKIEKIKVSEALETIAEYLTRS